MADITPPTGSATPPAETPPAAITPPVAPPAGGSGAPPAQVGPTTRESQLEKELSDARREAAGYRTQNKGELAEFKRQLAALAGGTPDAPGPTDPASILAQIQKERADEKQEIRRLKIDVGLNDIYSKVGAKPKLTRALLESEGILSTLDPSDAEFGATLNKAVKKLVDDNPELKVGPVPNPTAIRSSAPFPGGNNAPPQLTREDLKGMSDAEINTAREKGQLNQLLGRR